MIQLIQRNFTNTQRKDKVKHLKPDKHYPTNTYLARENHTYYALRTKHSLRGWQCYNNNNIITLIKGQRACTSSPRDQ